jgi:hypothetical protein
VVIHPSRTGRDLEASVLLCDYAQVVGGKLFISGAGIVFVGTRVVEPPYSLDLYAAILVEVPWQAHNQTHRLRVALVDEDERLVRIADPPAGETVAPEDDGAMLAQFNFGRSGPLQPGDSSLLPLAVPLRVQVDHLGAYTVSVSVDGSPLASARFRLLTTTQLGAS